MSHRTQNNQAGRQRSRRNISQRQIRNFNFNPQHLYEGQNFFIARDNVINNVFEHFEALFSCDNQYLEPTARDLLTCLSTELPALFQIARSDPIQISASWEALAMINVILLWPDRVEENIWQLTCPSFEGLVGVLIDDGAYSDYFAKSIVKCIACLGILSLEHSPEWGIKFLDWIFDILKQPLPSPSPTTPISPDMIIYMKGALFNVIRDFLHPQSPLKSPFLSNTAYNLLLSPVFPRILYHLCDLFNLCTNNNELFLNDFRFSDSLNLLEALRPFKPPALAEVFTNIIPPLLRIHLHPGAPSNVVKQITNIFANLAAFWGANHEFTVTILSSLLDEMEYVCGVAAEMAIPSSFVVSNHFPQLPTRVRFLSESIYAILEPFLSGFSPHASSKDLSRPNSPTSKAFQTIVYRVVRFIIFSRLNYIDNNEWRRLSKRTLNLLIAKIPDQFIAFQYLCVQLHLTYIPQPPKLISTYPLPNLQTWFCDLLNLLQSFNRIDILVATILLCPKSPLCQVKWTFAENQGVLNDLSKVVRSIVNVLSTSSISNVTDANDVAGQGNRVEEPIKNLLMDIQIEIVQLLKMASIEYGKRRISKLKLASQLDIRSCDEENEKHSDNHARNHQNSEEIQIDVVSQQFPLLRRLIYHIKDSSFSSEVCEVFNQPTLASTADLSAIEFSLLFDLLLLRDIVSLTESSDTSSISVIKIIFDFYVRLLVEILARNMERYSWGVGLLEVLYDQFFEFVQRHYQALPPDYFILFTLPFVISPSSRQIRYRAIRNIGETCSALQRSKSSLGGTVIALRSREIFEAMMVIEGCSLNLGDAKLRYEIADLWLVVFRNLGCGYLTLSCLELLMKRLNDTDPGIRIAYMNVLASLNPLQICHQKPATALPMYIRMFLRFAHQSPHSGSFRPAHFRIAMQSLNLAPALPTLDYIEVEPSSTETTSWLERLYHTCQGPKLLQPYYLEAKNVLPSAPDVSTEIISFIASVVTQQANVDVSGELLTQWCVWEASRYCILSRLKTPLGGPAQTFEAFERALKDCLAKEIDPMTDTSLEAGNSVLNVSTTLLFLIDLQRKQIYNAAVGTTYQFIPSAPKSAIQFFRANFNACSEWQHKIRMNVVRLARKIGNWSLVIQEGFLLVQSCLLELGKLLSGQKFDEAEEVIQKLEEVVVSLVEGIQRLEEPDVLVGLFVQLHYAFRGFYSVYGKGVSNPATRKRISPVSWEWLKGSIMMAKGRYEAAINEYCKHLMIKTLPPQTKQFLTRQVNDCYLALQSKSLEKWFNLFPQLECTDEWAEIQHECLKTLSQFSDAPSILNDDRLPALSSVSDISIFSDSVILTASKPIAASGIDSLLTQAQRAVTSPLFVMTPDKRHSSEHMLAAQLLLCVKDIRDGNAPVLVLDELESGSKSSSHTSLKVLQMADRILSSAPTHVEEIWNIRDRIFTGSRKSLNFASCEALLSAYESNNRFLFGSFMRHHFEKAKLTFAMGKHQTAIDSLLELTESANVDMTGSDGAVQAKVYSKLAKWVQTVKWNPDVGNDKAVQRIITSGVERNWIVPESSTRTADTVAQNALLLASQLCSTDPKIWFDYATYCYRKASKLLDVIVSPYSGSVVFEIAPELKSIVETVRGSSASDKGIPEKLRRCLLALLAHLGGGGFTDWSGDGLSPLEWVKQQGVFADSSQFDLVVTEFERLWKRIVDTLEGSLRGYFRFLKLHGGNDGQSTKDSDKSYDDIAATLRILRILWNSGSVFEHVFKAEFASTAVSSWKAVIPQLFARLDHPDAFVRSQLTELLTQLASEFPQFVLYHAIVGSTSATNAAEYKASLLQIQSRLDDGDGLVASTQVVIDELLKVTVLWEEVWLNKLSQLQADVSKRFQKLDAEMSRLKEDNVMSKSDKEKAIREMYSVVMKPVVVDLEKMCNNYLRRCSTPHEEWFQNTYGGRIQSALDSLIQPKTNRDIKSGWQEFSELYREFNRGLHRNRILKLSNVNPRLMKLKNTPVLMPGVFDCAERVTIKSFEPDFVVLATKTKPKKMTLMGSDGQTYRYLCKGVEDLHLDERIMQFMTTINHLLQRDRQTASRNLRARNYAVIPLGDQSGMIQWVDNATPAYTIFKKWQTNELDARRLFPNHEGNQPARETIAKPNELLYQKVAKIFKREGITKAVSRRNCTPEVLLEAHKELVNDTPSDLISRELWCSSVTPLDHFRKNLSISRSLAVMSMIGYIIGLGDRHLDNILIDFDQSEIIHIDYNICFERGKKLRVPEMVPFRLTQNFVDVLGVTGVEGTFRIACESVLTALRKHREVLTTLLETFVYDPLVDWNDDMKDDREKKLLEINVNLGLLASRIGEMWNPLEVARSSVVEALSSLDNVIGAVVAQSQSQSTDDNKQDEMYEICGQLRNEVEVFTTLFAQIRSLLNTLIEISEDLEEAKTLQVQAKDVISSFDKFISESNMLLDAVELAEEGGQDTHQGMRRLVSSISEQVDSLFADINLLCSVTPLEISITPQENPKTKDKPIPESVVSPTSSAQPTVPTASKSPIIGTELSQGGTQTGQLNEKLTQDFQNQLSSLEKQMSGLYLHEIEEQESTENQEDQKSKQSGDRDDRDKRDNHDDGDDMELELPAQPVHQYKKNVHALEVLKRIKVKLDGRDNETNKRVGVQEQVDMVIRQATDPGNLSLMYEGWTPWV
ncbi:hypothetical protein BKA69DRAFT_1038604 [Paraphysoderma sedebokerense]|nr:hypothetical protein BKA69DRAFT_1038604 [Paraphysoderma sedebokerense]